MKKKKMKKNVTRMRLNCLPHPAFVWVNTGSGYIQSANQEKARYNFHELCNFYFFFNFFILAKLQLFTVCMIHFTFLWLSYFHMWCLHELYICVSNPHSLISWQSWCSTCGHCRLGTHRITDLNFLVQYVKYETPLKWREAWAGMKVI